MMSRNQLVILLLILAIASGCEKGREPEFDGNLVFGVAYGFCAGDCAHFFKLENGALYKDVSDRYTGDDLAFDPAPLPAAKYDLAEPLKLQFPDYLKNNPNETIGCPDCADQGGYHLFLETSAEKQYWHIDTNSDNVPDEIRPYMSQLQSVLEQLRN